MNQIRYQILNNTKAVYQSFTEVNGKYVLNPSARGGWGRLSKEAIEFLSDYLNFVMNGDILNEITKIWMDALENNCLAAIRTYNQMHEGEEGFREIGGIEASNAIKYSQRKLLEYFPDNMLIEIYYKRGDLEVYKAMLQGAINKKLGKTLLGQSVVLKFPYSMTKEKPSEESIYDFIATIAPYTKKAIQDIERQAPKDVVGYINYISSKTRPTSEEKIILDTLKMIIEGVEVE